MKFTPEQITLAKTAKSAEDLISLAEKNGIKLSADDAEAFIARFKKEGELSDAELANVSGGLCEPDDAKISSNNPICPECGGALSFETNRYKFGIHQNEFLSDCYGRYDLFRCDNCGEKFRHHFEGNRWTED